MFNTVSSPKSNDCRRKETGSCTGQGEAASSGVQRNMLMLLPRNDRIRGAALWTPPWRSHWQEDSRWAQAWDIRAWTQSRVDFLKTKLLCLKDTHPNYTLKKKKPDFFGKKKTYQQNSKITDTSLISLPFKWLWWRHKRSREIKFKSSFSRCGAADMWTKLEWKDVLLGKRWRWPRHLKRGAQGDGEERGF